MSEITALTQELLDFRRERDWEQFHNPKDVSISLSLEAAEVLELFQWKSPEEIKEFVVTNKDDIGEELSDVINWVLLLSHDLGIDIIQASRKKIAQNRLKYPIDKAKGKHLKYNQLV